MEFITFNEFRLLNEYDDFIRENPDTGSLKVKVYIAGGAIPLSNTNILIFKQIGNYNVLFYNGLTDSMGNLPDIILPAPRRVPNNVDIPKNTYYELSAIHTGYQDLKQYTIAMFGNTNVIQYVRMIPEVTPVV